MSSGPQTKSAPTSSRTSFLGFAKRTHRWRSQYYTKRRRHLFCRYRCRSKKELLVNASTSNALKTPAMTNFPDPPCQRHQGQGLPSR